MKMQVLIVAMVALAACSHPTATSKSQSQEEAELQKAAEQYNAEQKNADDKVVCRMEEITGTRMKQKVCRTFSTMKKDERRVQQGIREQASTPPGGG